MPLMQLKMLVLPAPLGPMMAKKSVALTSRLTPARAITPPKRRCISSRVSNAIPAPFVRMIQSTSLLVRWSKPLSEQAFYFSVAPGKHGSTIRLGQFISVICVQSYCRTSVHEPYATLHTDQCQLFWKCYIGVRYENFTPDVSAQSSSRPHWG